MNISASSATWWWAWSVYLNENVYEIIIITKKIELNWIVLHIKCKFFILVIIMTIIIIIIIKIATKPKRFLQMMILNGYANFFFIFYISKKYKKAEQNEGQFFYHFSCLMLSFDVTKNIATTIKNKGISNTKQMFSSLCS